MLINLLLIKKNECNENQYCEILSTQFYAFCSISLFPRDSAERDCLFSASFYSISSKYVLEHDCYSFAALHSYKFSFFDFACLTMLFLLAIDLTFPLSSLFFRLISLSFQFGVQKQCLPSSQFFPSLDAQRGHH